MAVGYVLEITLAFLFALLAYGFHRLAPDPTRSPTRRFWKVIIDRCFAAFFECAIYFSLAVQLASIVFLAKRDFGVAPEGFGANEMQISLTACVVCMLPLLYPIALLPMDGKDDDAGKRRNLHFFLLSLAALLFCYPFLSQGIHTWAPTRIGKGNDEGQDTIDDDEWVNLATVCLGDVRQLSDSEKWALAVLLMVSSLIVYLFIFWEMFGRTSILRAQEREKGGFFWRGITGRMQGALRSGLVQAVLLISPTALAASLLYFIFELRSIQEEFTLSIGGKYTGNDWGFGQVISVTIFAPVLVEFLYSLMYV